MEDSHILNENLDQIQGELINLIQNDGCKLLKTTENFEIMIPNRDDPTKVYFKHSSSESSHGSCDRTAGAISKQGIGTNYKKYPMRSDVSYLN